MTKSKKRQINRLTIYNTGLTCDPKPFKVKTPDGRILEEFTELDAAADFCRKTTDFTKRT